jgi:hypothetical protein
MHVSCDKFAVTLCCCAMLVPEHVNAGIKQVDHHFSADERLETHKPKVAMKIRSM